MADGLLAAMGSDAERSSSSMSSMMRDLQSLIDSQGPKPDGPQWGDHHQEPHHLHVYATKHNTHITLTSPNKDPIISLSTGNLGFRKSHRGTYDAAFQLAAFVMRNIQERGMLRHGYDGSKIQTIDRLALILRGFGPGREAVTKALLGNEGRRLRDRIVEVADATRIKFGGTRSPNPRRLG